MAPLTQQLYASVADSVIRYTLAVLLLCLSLYDLSHFSVLKGHLIQVALPPEILYTIIAAQIMGVVVLVKAIRIPLSAMLLAINSAICAECLNSNISWVLMAGFLVLALHSKSSDRPQGYCGPLM